MRITLFNEKITYRKVPRKIWAKIIPATVPVRRISTQNHQLQKIVRRTKYLGTQNQIVFHGLTAETLVSKMRFWFSASRA